MPALNFKKQFADVVETGEKRCTIRAIRKRQFRTGDTLYHFTGMRSASCRRLGTTMATRVRPIVIYDSNVRVEGHDLAPFDIQTLAQADGFSSTNDFFRFFKETHELPFYGQLIEW